MFVVSVQSIAFVASLACAPVFSISGVGTGTMQLTSFVARWDLLHQ